MKDERIDSRDIISDYIFFSKYSRVKADGKKESWTEAVDRVMDMHWDFFMERLPEEKMDDFAKAWSKARDFYHRKRILGSQRALQYGGPQLLKNHLRLYNCSATYCDRIEFFEELAELLLSGAGTGYSVQRVHTEKLPIVKGVDREQKQKYIIPDSIEGWSRSWGVLIESYYYNLPVVEFDYSQIRPEGAYVSGGFKAPGPDPLERSHKKIRALLDKVKVRRLRPFECHYLACIIADAVISGGIRRSAMISMFDLDEQEMLSCKTLNWFITYPELCRANNSVVILPDTKKEDYKNIISQVKQFGEPGIIFTDSQDYVYNPCCFTGDTLVAIADGRNAVSIKELAETDEVFPIYYKNNYGKVSICNGKAFCTGEKPVVEITLSNGSKFRCTEDHPLQMQNGNYVEAKESKGVILSKFFSSKRKYRTINSFTNGYARQYRMIYEFYHGQKRDGYEIDHIDNAKGDFIENLQEITLADHLLKTAEERKGDNNPIHKVDPKIRKSAAIANSTLEKNGRYAGLSNEDCIELGKKVLSLGKTPNNDNCKKLDPRFPTHFSKNRFNGSLALFQKYVYGELEYQDFERPVHISTEKEDFSYLSEDVYVVDIAECDEIEEVYDIEMDCPEHNFAIITKGDSDYGNSEGIFVHNCEVGMFPQEDGKSGWGFCNLCEINGALIKTEQDFYDACEAASILGTFQAAYVDFPVLSEASKKIAQRDALIGVGITGIADNPGILLNEEIQKRGAEIVKAANKYVSKLLGINEAARTTVIKPSGNSSQLLGCGSGIHSYHFRKYIRHIQAANTEQALQEQKIVNPYIIEPSAYNKHGESVLAFPIELDEKALVRTEVPTIDFLKNIYLTKMNWIEEGTNFDHQSTKVNPSLRMNVSCTISVKDDEWDEVTDWIWDHKKGFCGLSFLPETGDLEYPQAPYTSYLDEKELAETYGQGAILSSGLIVDGLRVFDSIYTACDAALGRADQLLKLTDEDISTFITSNIKEGHFLAEIDGLRFSDVNAVIDHLQSKVKDRVDWVRRFEKFAHNHFDDDKVKCSHCLKHVNIFHKWQKIKNQNPIDWEAVKWEVVLQEAGEQVGTACAGGKCEI